MRATRTPLAPGTPAGGARQRPQLARPLVMSQSSPKGAGAALGGHVGRPASPWLRLLRASPLTRGARHTCEQLGSLGHGSCHCALPSSLRDATQWHVPGPCGVRPDCPLHQQQGHAPHTACAPFLPRFPEPSAPTTAPSARAAHALSSQALRGRPGEVLAVSTLVRRVGDVRMERPCRPGRRRSDTEEAAAGPGGHARGLRSCFLLTWLCSQLILFTDYLELFEI